MKEVIVNHEVMNEESLWISTQNIASRLDETLAFAMHDVQAELKPSCKMSSEHRAREMVEF